MSNVNMDGLPPEMQARIASIIEGAKQKVQPESPHQAAMTTQPQAPVAQAPTLMDHVIALRQEVAALRSEVNAVGTSYRGCRSGSGLDVSDVSSTDRAFKFQHKFPSDCPAAASRRGLLI